MPTLNATVFPDEAYVLVQADWSDLILRDTFSRVVVNDWGSANTGQDYNPNGGVGTDYQVDGSSGTITHTAVNTSRAQITNTTPVVNADFYSEVTNPVLPTGSAIETSRYLRWVDNNNFLQARIFFNTDGTITANTRQVVAAVQTVSSTVTIPNVNVGDLLAVRYLAMGSQTFLRVWELGQPEPTSWHVGQTVTWLTAGQIGVANFIGAGYTGPLPLTLRYDNFVVTALDSCPIYAGVTRRNTVTGEVVPLRPYVAYDSDGNLLLDCCMGLWWDTEPPLNVPLEYCTIPPLKPVNVVENCCFETGTAPWQVYFSSGTLATSTVFEHEGLQSALFTPSGSFLSPRFFQNIASGFVGTDPVTVSAWALSPQGWNAVWLELQVNYVNGFVESFQSPVEILDESEWRFLQTTFTPTAEIASAVFYFRIGGMPANTVLFYVDEMRVTQMRASETPACETVTVVSDSVWLKNPLHPCSDIEVSLCSPMLDDCGEDGRVSYLGHEDDSYSPNTVLLTGPNRQRPVAVNRLRMDAASTLRLLAHNCEARDDVLQSNQSGDPLFFQAPATYCIPDRYISVGVLTESRISVDQREDFRVMSLPYVTVDRPEGPADGVCGTRIEDLCDIYTTWSALSATGLSWNDLLLGEASPNGPGQPEPPAGQRVWLDVETDFANWAAVEADGTWADIRDGT